MAPLVLTASVLQGFALRAATRRLRTISEFAEQEIVLPDGPFVGLRFRLNRDPVSRLLLGELDSGKWQRVVVIGPNQLGKTLLAVVIPIMWLLFEAVETVILGVPSLDIVADKWKVDLLPAIKASKYAELLPNSGMGSRQGESVLYEFGNGSRLRFMTAGGNDQARAGFTSRNLVVTEADGFGVIGGSSREGDKFSQLERRTLAYGDRKRVIAESTVGFEQGLIWQEYINGTHSRIALPCPHCAAWVTPERENLHGWQEAESEIAAVEAAHVRCPACGEKWSNEQRLEANARGVLVHKGQDVVPDGTITGAIPQTHTLGFRWTAINAALDPRRLSLVGGIEWRTRRAADEDSAERDLCQSQWALPARPDKIDVSQLDAMSIMRRTLPKRRGIVPDDTQVITIGCDVGKRLCHWTAVAWRPFATPHVLDYGRLEVPSDQMAEEAAIQLSLRDFRDTLADGWKCGTLADGKDRILNATFVFVDAGNWSDTILNFCLESGPPFFASRGYGIGQRREGGGRGMKRETGSKVIWQKEGYGLIQLSDGRHYIEVKADFWKSWLHARLHTPLEKSGAMTLFDSNDHLSFAKHLTAEKQVQEFRPKEGMVTFWEAISGNNHWLDATTLACVAGYEAGVRLMDAPAAPVATPPPPVTISRPAWLPTGGPPRR